MLKLVLLVVIAMARAQEISVCRSGQTIVIPLLSLSPYDELGNCRVSDYFASPTSNPVPAFTSAPAVSSSSPNPPATAATSAPATTPAPTSASTSTAPTSEPITTIPTSAPATAGPSSTMTSAPGTLGPNATVPDNAVTPTPIVLPAAVPVAFSQTGIPVVATPQPAATLPQSDILVAATPQPAVVQTPAILPPNDMPTQSAMGPIGQNASAPVAHQDHEDAHEWQATGSFSHGHMLAVVKAKNRVLPNNLDDANDPKTRVLVFLQWFSSESVYEHPQQVFMFFTKPNSQRTMRIN